MFDAFITLHQLELGRYEVRADLTEPAHGYQLLIPLVADSFQWGEYSGPFDFAVGPGEPYVYEGGVVMAAICDVLADPFCEPGPGEFTLGTLTFDACVTLEPGCISVFCTEFSYAGEPVETSWEGWQCPLPPTASQDNRHAVGLPCWFYDYDNDGVVGGLDIFMALVKSREPFTTEWLLGLLANWGPCP